MRPLGLLLLALLLACGAWERGGEVTRPNILFVLIDTLRFDHLSLYGYPRPTSPRIDALAARSLVFDAHVSHGSQTVPATLSLLLSQLPAEHGFMHRRKGQYASNPPRYPERLVFLTEVLREAGYRTGGFVGNPFLGTKNGFAQGFERFVHAVRDDRLLTDAVVDFVGDTREDSPFFAYVHLFQVHGPYQAPSQFRALFPGPPGGQLLSHAGQVGYVPPLHLAFTKAAYDAGVRYADSLVGEMLDALEAAGVAGQTLVVVTSDHGEEFLEHGGLGHGTHVFGELVRAPLILFDPRNPGAGRRLAHLTRGLDLAPTLLDLIGMSPPETFRGGSLFVGADQAVVDEGPWRGVYADGFKLVRRVEDGLQFLFDAEDALDLQGIEGRRAVRRSLGRHLDAYAQLETSAAAERPAAGRGEAAESWTEAELEQLRALGYVP